MKKHKLSIRIFSCILANGRNTSIRQQSNQITSSAGDDIAASSSTVFRRREKSRCALSLSVKLKITEQSFCKSIMMVELLIEWIDKWENKTSNRIDIIAISHKPGQCSITTTDSSKGFSF